MQYPIAIFVERIAMADTFAHIGAPNSKSRSYLMGMALVFTAGVCWSFGGLWLRLISSSDIWQVFLYRSIFLMIAMVPIIFYANRGRFFDIFYRAGWNGIIAGFCLALASLSYILALTYTTIANAAFMIGAVPFFSALLGWWLLRERVSKQTMIAIAVAFCGMGLMVGAGVGGGAIIGNMLAVYASLAFACYTVILRWDERAEMLPSVFWSGIFVAGFALVILVFPSPFRETHGISTLVISGHDLALCMIMGFVQLALGLILYTLGAKSVPAAELGLATLVEPVLGTAWVWLFVNEVPTMMTLIGGAIIMAAIAGRAMSGVMQNRLPRAGV
jgi:DME family drug/metabolite transporter